MKIMSKDLLVKLDSVERVKVEIEILKTIHHPHIVNLVEVFFAGGVFLPFLKLIGFCFQVMASETSIYIVMELMSGGELLERLGWLTFFSFLLFPPLDKKKKLPPYNKQPP